MHEAQTQRSSQLRSEDVVLGTQRELLAQEEGRRGRRRVYLAKVESAYGAASTSGARGGVAIERTFLYPGKVFESQAICFYLKVWANQIERVR